uniref:Dscam n=1 Tax=Strigamia maritima TaxID=126957 RepID=T1JE42_STRMM
SDAKGRKNKVQDGNGVRLLTNGSLEIKNVNLNHAGYYFCLSENAIGSISESHMIYLSAVPPQLHKKFQNNTVQKGDSVHFKCVAHGDQPMTFTWYINGVAFNENSNTNDPFGQESISSPLKSNCINRYVIKQSNDDGSVTSEFAIKKADRKDSTSFICSAENSYGSENATFSLMVLEKPDAPEDVRIAGATNRTVVVEWTAPFSGNNPINKYILQYKLIA